jgi:hypothetical protein
VHQSSVQEVTELVDGSTDAFLHGYFVYVAEEPVQARAVCA